QAGADPEVLPGHSVGPTAVGVSGDCLPVGDIENREQSENDDDYGADVDQPDGAEWQENGEGRLRPIGGGRQAVESQGGDAGQDADLPLRPFGGGEPPPEDQAPQFGHGKAPEKCGGPRSHISVTDRQVTSYSSGLRPHRILRTSQLYAETGIKESRAV